MSEIRILIVEDQAMLSSALSTLLSYEEDFKIVATAENGVVALETLSNADIDLVLTDREREILRLIEIGEPTAKIASTIHLSKGTVRNYLSDAISKLDAKNRIDAARIARKKGWL